MNIYIYIYIYIFAAGRQLDEVYEQNALLREMRFRHAAFHAVSDGDIDEYGDNAAEIVSDRMAAALQEDEYGLNLL